MSNVALPNEEQFLTKPELARRLKVSLRTITTMMAQGDLPYLKLNGHLVRFRLEDVNRRLSETSLVCNGDEGIDTSPHPLPGRGGEGIRNNRQGTAR
jgi:excisionase family DNA binding protein